MKACTLPGRRHVMTCVCSLAGTTQWSRQNTRSNRCARTISSSCTAGARRLPTRHRSCARPASAHPGPDTLRRIDHEYSLRAELDTAWTAQPLALSHYNGQPVLALRDPGGDPLDGLFHAPIAISRFLRIALGLATALKHVHQRQLIHKDVKPSNILVDPSSDQIWLTGFGIASRVPRERQPPAPPEFIAGTLPYMAPEQTGRMNRSIDRFAE